jgi:hypothetical protein
MLNKRHLKQQAMDFDKIAEKVFKIDPNLRFISVVDRDDQILLARMREGISAVNVAQRDEDLASIYPPLIMRAVERLQPKSRKCESSKYTLRQNTVDPMSRIRPTHCCKL